jgi:hypothetical protein
MNVPPTVAQVVHPHPIVLSQQRDRFLYYPLKMIDLSPFLNKLFNAEIDNRRLPKMFLLASPIINIDSTTWASALYSISFSWELGI